MAEGKHGRNIIILNLNYIMKKYFYFITIYTIFHYFNNNQLFKNHFIEIFY